MQNSECLQVAGAGIPPGVDRQQSVWQTQPVTSHFSLMQSPPPPPTPRSPMCSKQKRFTCFGNPHIMYISLEQVEPMTKLVTGTKQLWVPLPALFLSGIVKWGKLLRLSGPRFNICKMGIKAFRSFTSLLGMQCYLIFFLNLKYFY